MARRFTTEKRGRWTVFSIVTGVAFVGVASGSGSPAVVFGFWAALILAWAWLASVSVDRYRRTR
jgi:MYXO-CTERM domain-containing protein